jgi:glyoxylase-like metal-dependent hydrolase (beta-lactamase superfamily II)
MLQVTAMPLGALDTNCYVLNSDREAVVIDPGGDAHEILSFLEAGKLTLERVLNTHLHFDHIQGNADLVAATGVSVMANPKDAYLLDTELGGGGMWGFPRTPSFTIEALEEGEMTLLGTTCRVLATPGHSPGSLSFYFESLGAVFVGDLLFYRSVGRTDFPGSSERELMRSVRTKIFTLPEDTVVYPGHGPETTVGQERLNNPFFTEFIR